MKTDTLGLPLLVEGQNGAFVTHNEALSLIDNAFPKVVLSASLSIPPESPMDGDSYIIPQEAVGWPDGESGWIARRLGGVWYYGRPKRGLSLYVIDEGGKIIYDGQSWRKGSILGALGGVAGLSLNEIHIELTGESVIAPALIPSRAIVLGVTAYTLEAVSGVDAYQVGSSGQLSQFGGWVSIGAGSHNIGVVGPFATYSPLDIIVSPLSGEFTGGKVYLGASYIEFGVPSYA